MTDPVLFIIAAIVGLLGWFARGWWERRQALLQPRLVDAALAAIAKVQQLDQPDVAGAAAKATDAATMAAKRQALKDAAAKLT